MRRKKQFDPPSNTFPYKIVKRLNALSVPRRYIYETSEGMPEYTARGIRKSALRGQTSDRVKDISWPYLRRLLTIKKMYKHRFSPDRIERIDRMIEATNATMYTKLANCAIDLKKPDIKDSRKKRAWTETEWKKHMEYIGQVAAPKKVFKPPPSMRGKTMPLEALLPRIKQIASLPNFKQYKRLSQETWYRDPRKVSPNAMKYVITDRMKKLAAPRVIQQHS